MDVSRETPDVTTKPKCYDLTNVLVCVFFSPLNSAIVFEALLPSHFGAPGATEDPAGQESSQTIASLCLHVELNVLSLLLFEVCNYLTCVEII